MLPIFFFLYLTVYNHKNVWKFEKSSKLNHLFGKTFITEWVFTCPIPLISIEIFWTSALLNSRYEMDFLDEIFFNTFIWSESAFLKQTFVQMIAFIIVWESRTIQKMFIISDLIYHLKILTGGKASFLHPSQISRLLSRRK